MVKIDAIIREEKYEEVADALKNMNVHGMTITQVMGCGAQLGYTTVVRGSKVEVNVLPKIKFEIVVSTKEWADKVVDLICKTANTGNHGDGKIFVYELSDVVRIRTGEHGPRAVWSEEQRQEEAGSKEK